MRMTIAIATMLVARLLASPDASPEKLLEAAIYQAKVVGDLQGAIQQFDSIASRYSGKPVAARALVEIGRAEEQLGHTDRARGAYTRVLKDYRDQVQLVAQVQRNLESMSDATSGPRNLSFEQGESGKVPDGWFAAVGNVELAHQGCRSAACVSVWLPEGSPKKFGNIMQTFQAANYRGKTVRIRAWLRLDSATPDDSAQMWFRVDRPNRKMGAFDNMGDRPVQVAQWTQAEIVAKVDADAEMLNIGVMSLGKGRAWVDGMSFEVVPDGTPTTTRIFLQDTPQNLNFAQGQIGRVPNGWFTPVGRSELSRQGCRSSACVAIWLEPNSTAPFGNLMQTVNAAPFRGKTVRLRAWLRVDASTEDDKAQMWFRVDLPNRKMGAFDNMGERPVQSANWTSAEIVGKVAAEAETLNFGVMALGKGRAWVDGVTLEVVPDATPSTGVHQ